MIIWPAPSNSRFESFELEDRRSVSTVHLRIVSGSLCDRDHDWEANSLDLTHECLSLEITRLHLYDCHCDLLSLQLLDPCDPCIDPYPASASDNDDLCPVKVPDQCNQSEMGTASHTEDCPLLFSTASFC